jgi:hypothetical protein
MTYRKEEVQIDGHEVIVQQTRGPDSTHGASPVHAWVDGGKVPVSEMLDEYDISVSGENAFDRVKATVRVMVNAEVRFCSKCREFRGIDSFVSTGFAGRKCHVCADKDSTCQDGDEHDDKCLNPRQKHNARLPTKYKCTKCGRVRKTTPTG